MVNQHVTLLRLHPLTQQETYPYSSSSLNELISKPIHTAKSTRKSSATIFKLLANFLIISKKKSGKAAKTAFVKPT
jgi:hypothetical protein